MAEGLGAQPHSAARSLRVRLLIGVVGSLLVGVLAVALAFAYTRSDRDASLTRPLRVGAPAPEFAVTALDGERLTLSGLRGRPVWLNFWATWCQPCRAEMPELVAVGQEARASGVRLIAIDVGESPEEVRAFLERGKYQGLPAALDPDLRAAGAYRAFAFPSTCLSTRKGSCATSTPGR